MEDRKLDIDIEEVLRVYNQACLESDTKPIDTMDFLMVVCDFKKAWNRMSEDIY